MDYWASVSFVVQARKSDGEEWISDPNAVLQEVKSIKTKLVPEEPSATQSIISRADFCVLRGHRGVCDNEKEHGIWFQVCCFGDYNRSLRPVGCESTQ